jgi:hypothetical protein
MSQIIKIKRSSATALVDGVSTLNFGELAVTDIGGVKKYYVGASDNTAKEVAGDSYAKLASPALTGTPTAPTASPGDNSTKLATTAYADAAAAAAAAAASTDLSEGTRTDTSYEILSSTGNSVTLLEADAVNAGLLTSANFTALTEIFERGRISVADEAARFALTTGDVINGGSPVNIVYQVDTKQVFLVVDNLELDNAAGYLLIASNINDSISTSTNLYSAEKVDSQIAAAVTGLFDYKGGIDCSTNPNYPAASVGDVYKVTVPGKIGGASGLVVEVGDSIYCNADSAGGTQATVGSDFNVIQVNIDVDALAGAGLVVNAGNLDVNVDNSSIEINADALRVKAGGITNAMLAGSIADSKLLQLTTANKVAGSAVQLGTNSGLSDSTGLIVNVDDSTIEKNSGTLRVKDAGITAAKIAASAIGNGLTGGAGTAIAVVSDATGGANLSRSINVSANGVAVKVDAASIIEGASNRLEVGTIDCGTF